MFVRVFVKLESAFEKKVVSAREKSIVTIAKLRYASFLCCFDVANFVSLNLPSFWLNYFCFILVYLITI